MCRSRCEHRMIFEEISASRRMTQAFGASSVWDSTLTAKIKATPVKSAMLVGLNLDAWVQGKGMGRDELLMLPLYGVCRRQGTSLTCFDTGQDVDEVLSFYTPLNQMSSFICCKLPIFFHVKFSTFENCTDLLSHHKIGKGLKFATIWRLTRTRSLKFRTKILKSTTVVSTGHDASRDNHQHSKVSWRPKESPKHTNFNFGDFILFYCKNSRPKWHNS